jgi:hypothetical protein
MQRQITPLRHLFHYNLSTGVINMRERVVKTISDVKKIQIHWLLYGFRNKNCQEMALKSIKRLILSIDGASIKLVLAVLRLHFKREQCTFHPNF